MNRSGKVRTDVVEHQVPLGQRLTHQREIPVLQISQPTVEELAGATRRPRRVVALLDERDREPA